jgi:protein phosphatase
MPSRKSKISHTVQLSNEKQPGVKMFVDGDAYIMIRIGNSSHQGARDYQEDSFGYSNIIDSDVINEKGFTAVLSDGMGGLSNGKAISEYVVSSFIKMFSAIDYTAAFSEQLEDMVTKINSEVCRNFTVDSKSGAGATIVASFIYKTKLYWICVGDSRIYLLRNNSLYAINEDHDYFNQLLSDLMVDKITLDEIKADVQKDTLASYIGNDMLPSVDANKHGFSLCKGDMLILCSDGIYGGISNDEMIGILKANEPQKASEKITQSVLNKRIAGQDNLTVMVIKFEEE